ncbi:helix-turn-helix transcriptional regulator [Clostridioides sp. GD02377]|uniref:helix-turn-helix transcriptional regulator n=1 Tax=unclassified Clostridioides TaxID=2635829 RepID=UPI0038A904F9
MGKIDNALKIIMVLKDNKILKAREIANELNISERQVKEYMSQLRRAGIDVKSKPGNAGGYYIEQCPFCARLKNRG